MKKIFLVLLLTLNIFQIQLFSQEITRGELLNLFHKAQKAQKINEIGEAIEIYKNISDKAPLLWQPYLALGVLYSVEGENQNNILAIKSYKKYLELVPEASNDSIRYVMTLLESKISDDEQGDTQDEVDNTGLQEQDQYESLEIDNDVSDILHVSSTSEKQNNEISQIQNTTIAVKDFNIPLSDKLYTGEATSGGSLISSLFMRNKISHKGVFEVQGRIVEELKKELKVDIGNNTVISIPLSKILMIEYEDGSKNITDKKELKNILKEYRKTATELYGAGLKKQSVKLFERIIELEPDNWDVYRVLGEIYSNTSDIAELKIAKGYLSTYLSNISNTDKYYPKTKDRLEYLNDRINNFDATTQQYEFLKSLEGTWIADYYYENNMIPMWIFNIKCDDNSYGVELHKGSLRYSEELYSEIETPQIENDSIIYFSFTNGKAYIPSKAGYFISHLFTDISDPRYVYIANRQESKVSEERFNSIEEQTKKFHDAIENARTKDIPNANKTLDEFKIQRISKNIFIGECIETMVINENGKIVAENRDTIICPFYKIPTDMPFIMLGNNNCLITNSEISNQREVGVINNILKEYRKYAKNIKLEKAINYKKLKYPFHQNEELNKHMADFDATQFMNWYSNETKKNSLKFLGKLVLSTASVGVGVWGMSASNNELIMTLSETLYRAGSMSAKYFFDTIEDDLTVNPSTWNVEKYDFLKYYYKNNK